MYTVGYKTVGSSYWSLATEICEDVGYQTIFRSLHVAEKVARELMQQTFTFDFCVLEVKNEPVTIFKQDK